MVEKGANGEHRAGEDGVLGGLPTTRPTRLSRRARDGETPAPAAPEEAPAKPKAARRAAKPKAARAAPPPPTDQETPPTPLRAAEKRPRPVRAGHPELQEPSEKATAVRSGTERSGESGGDLIKTMVQVAVELASLSAAIFGQVLKHVFDRLPRRP